MEQKEGIDARSKALVSKVRPFLNRDFHIPTNPATMRYLSTAMQLEQSAKNQLERFCQLIS